VLGRDRFKKGTEKIPLSRIFEGFGARRGGAENQKRGVKGWSVK